MNRLLVIPIYFLILLVGNPAFSANEIQKSKEAISKKDYRTAIRTLEPLARQGNPVAQLNLGVMYKKGHGVTQDDAVAVKWYRLAAEQGNAGAQFNLGNAYYNGAGVLKNRSAAVKLYNLAANQGHISSIRVLETMFKIGLDGAKIGDFVVALREWEPLAEHGLAKAQMNIGTMYYKGDGVKKNLKIALSWYLKAAKQGIRKGEFKVASMYNDGEGIEKNPKEALIWFAKAAKQGDTHAQVILSAALAIGEIVTRNVPAALFWAYAAKIEGNVEANNILEVLGKKVTPSMSENMERLARECVEKHFKGC